MPNRDLGKWDDALAGLPTLVRRRLVTRLGQVHEAYLTATYEACEAAAGKFCEGALRALQAMADQGQYTRFGTRIGDFAQACRRFENKTGLPDSVRFHIPALISALYGMRNKRGVAHEGEDVDPSQMDAALMGSVVRWVMAEFVRIAHALEPEEARAVVDRLTSAPCGAVWPIDGKQRVLRTDLSYADQTLVLLYGVHPDRPSEDDLVSWTEYSNPAVYRRDVLPKLHKERLVEYDKAKKTLAISPKGIKYVEEHGLLEVPE